MTEHQPLSCASCGYDMFVEIRLTETRSYGHFAATDRASLLIEEVDQQESRDRSVLLKCTRCGEPAYEWLSPVGSDAGSASRRSHERDRLRAALVEIIDLEPKMEQPFRLADERGADVANAWQAAAWRAAEVARRALSETDSRNFSDVRTETVRRPGSMHGEDFVRSLGFDEEAAAERTRTARRQGESARALRRRKLRNGDGDPDS